jgi:hypothetical protein
MLLDISLHHLNTKPLKTDKNGFVPKMSLKGFKNPIYIPPSFFSTTDSYSINFSYHNYSYK